MTALPVVPVAAVPLADPVMALPPAAPVPAAGRAGSFADMLTGSLDSVSAKVADADRMARAFALDDSIPVHQVTYALEQARLSLEMMTQIRSRMIDGFQQLMNMPI